jgi:AraC-like DNA-binding protein
MSPIEYINQERVKRACRLLTDEHLNVTDVSFELGYSSLSYFIKLFKEHTGTTPKQYQLKKLSS